MIEFLFDFLLFLYFFDEIGDKQALNPLLTSNISDNKIITEGKSHSRKYNKQEKIDAELESLTAVTNFDD